MTDKLIRDLCGIAKPALTTRKKREMKMNIMGQIHAPANSYMKNFVTAVGLDALTRARIKERVFAIIQNKEQKSFIIQNFFAFHRKLVSALVLFMMVFGMFSYVNVGTNVVFASTFTSLKSFTGEVSVERNGKFIDVKEGMYIYENDKVVTGKNSYASIAFLDDSISRLAAETQLVINKLYKPSRYSAKTNVEISLLAGDVWSRVVNLVEEQSSFTVKVNEVFATSKRAAFDVELQQKGVEINVFKNVVDVHTPKKVETLVSGQKATLDTKNNVRVRTIAQSEKNEQWVKSNLNDDKAHMVEVEKRLLVAKIQSVGVNENQDPQYGNSVKDDVMLFLTFDDVKREKMALDLAEKDFIAAEVQLNAPDLTDEAKLKAENAISAFSDKMKAFYKTAEKVGYTDTQYSEELKNYAKDKILLQKKNLALVLPGSPSYQVKETVESLELLSADNNAEIAQVKHEQSLEKLSEAEEAVDKGDYETASVAVESYKKNLSAVVTAVDSVEESDLKENLVSQIEGSVKLLDTINVVPETEVAQIKTELGLENPAGDSTVAGNAVVDDTAQASAEPQLGVPETQETYGVTIEGDKPLPPLLNAE